MRKGRDGEKNGKKKQEKKEKRRMKIVATTSLPAVDRPNADRWNAARSRQLDYCKHVNVNSPRSGEKFLRGGDWPHKGGNDLHSTVSPPVPPPGNPEYFVPKILLDKKCFGLDIFGHKFFYTKNVLALSFFNKNNNNNQNHNFIGFWHNKHFVILGQQTPKISGQQYWDSKHLKIFDKDGPANTQQYEDN